MARKLEIADVDKARQRFADTVQAQRSLNDAAAYLYAAGAMQTLRRVRAAKKSMQGAVNHARMRFRTAQRVAEFKAKAAPPKRCATCGAKAEHAQAE